MNEQGYELSGPLPEEDRGTVQREAILAAGIRVTVRCGGEGGQCGQWIASVGEDYIDGGVYAFYNATLGPRDVRLPQRGPEKQSRNPGRHGALFDAERGLLDDPGGPFEHAFFWIERVPPGDSATIPPPGLLPAWCPDHGRNTVELSTVRDMLERSRMTGKPQSARTQC